MRVGLARRSIAIGSCAAVLLFAVTAYAADYEALMSEGVSLRRSGDDRAALKRFQQAYGLNKTARALAQIGLAEQAIGSWGAADRHLREALEAKDDPWIVKNGRSIEQALVVISAHVGRLEVSGTPAGAEVRVDGEMVGQLPLPRPVTVTAGGVAVEIRAPGHVPIVRATDVGARALTRETFTLQSMFPTADARAGGGAGARQDKDASGAADISGSASSPSGGADSTPADPSDPAAAATNWGSPRRVLVLVSAGLAAASLAFGVIEHLSWQDGVEKFGARSDCGTLFPGKGGVGCAKLYDDGQRARTLAFIGYGVAAGFAATAAILHFTAPDSRTEGSKLACAPLFATPGLGCAFVF